MTCSDDATLWGFTPEEVTEFARPVQVEDATRGLCGAQLPDGRGILVWPLGTNVRYAITDTPRDWLVNDVVTAGQISTAFSVGAGNVLRRTSVWALDGNLFVAVLWRGPFSSTVPYNKLIQVYRANSATNPTAWSLWGTVQTVPGGTRSLVERALVVGIPYQMSTGRLVLCGTSWQLSGGGSGTMAGAWSSTDGGQTWGQHVHQGYGTGQAWTQFISGQVGCDPATGTLIWFAGTNQFGRRHALYSPDGTSWTQSANLDQGLTLMVYPFNNGQRAVLFHGASIRVPSGDPWDPTTWGPSLGRWFPVGGGGSAGGNLTSEAIDTAKAVLASGGVYPFWIDRVSFMAAGGWTVGRIGT